MASEQKKKQPDPEAPDLTKKRVFRFSDSLYEAWRRAAQARGISISELIRRAVDAYIGN